MRALAILAATLLNGGLTAQEVRLIDVVPAPLAFLSVDQGGEAALGLLDDPVLRALVGAPEPTTGEDGAITALRRLLDLSTGDVELVLTGLLPRPDSAAMPLMLGRVRLSDAGRETLRTALDAGEVGEASRSVGTHTVYRWAGSERRPGGTVEVAIVGADLLVANQALLFDAAVQRLGGGTAEPLGDSLTADPTFRRLEERLGDRPNAARLYLDWKRMCGKVYAAIAGESHGLLDLLGPASARHLLCGIDAESDAFETVALIDQDDGPDGVLAIARPESVRRLLQELPGTGLGVFAFALDHERLTPRSLGRGVHASLVGGCRSVGIDFDRQIAPRLGQSAACRVLMLGDAPGVAFAVEARSRRHALGLLDDLEAQLGRMPFGMETHGTGDTRVVEVQLPRAGSASIGVAGDALVVGLEKAVVDGLFALEREATARDRARRRADTEALLQRIVARDRSLGREAVGVFDLEIAAADGARAADSRAGRHAGLVFLEDGLVRVEMVSLR